MYKARRHELIHKRYEELCHYNSTTTTALYISKWVTYWNTYHYSYLPCSSLNLYSFRSLPPACFLSPKLLLFFSILFLFFLIIHLFIHVFFCLTCYKYIMEARSKMLPKENVSFLFTLASSLPSFLRSSPIHLSLSLYYFILFHYCSILFYILQDLLA